MVPDCTERSLKWFHIRYRTAVLGPECFPALAADIEGGSGL